MKHQTKISVENHTNRIDHVKDRILELEQDRGIWSVMIKKKCKRYNEQGTTALWDTMEKQNLWLMSIQEREDLHTKWIGNTFNKILGENFPNLEKEIAI